MQNLTDAFLRNIKGDGQQTDYRDAKTSGLVLRVSGPAERTTKSWGVMYRRKSDGKRRRVTFGSYPQYSLSDARQEALKIMSQVARGEDPVKEKKRATISVAPKTFGELAARYLESHPSNRTLSDDRQMLNKDILPALEGEPLSSIQRADIVAIIDAIMARGSPIRANRTFSVIRKIFNWGVGKGYIQFAPTYQMKLPAKEASRDRILTAEEVRLFWRRLVAGGKFGWEMRMLLKLLLVTGQRVSEVAGMTRHELHFDKAEWHIPGARTKNKYTHIVPLSPLALRLIEKSLKRSADNELVLPTGRKQGQIKKYTPAQTIRENRDLFGFKADFTPHDLRRTVGSGLGELGYTRLIQDKVLNHADSSIGSVYDRYAYMKEKREALEAWADHLQAIIFDRPRAVVVKTPAVKPNKRHGKKVASPWATAS